MAGYGLAGTTEANVGEQTGADKRLEDVRAGDAKYGHLKIAAIYARVSTGRQEKEQTIDSQLDALYRAAEEGGYEVAPSPRIR